MVQRWEPGDLFGSEVELITRYGVGRAVFREAVRFLEHHGLAKMRRGLHGGLFIRQPDPSSSPPLRGEGRPGAGGEALYREPAEPL